MRPHLPVFLENQEIISIAILLAGMLAPVAIGSVVMATDLLSKVTLFGMSVTTNAAKLTLAVAKTAVQVPVALVTKPLYWLTSPFRKGQTSQELSVLMKDKWREGNSKGLSGSGRVLVGLREKGSSAGWLFGSLPGDEKVGCLLPLVRKKFGRERESLQFVCGGNLVSMDEPLKYLGSSSSGIVEIEFLILEAFG